MNRFEPSAPPAINAIEWAQAKDRARHICARIFRDGGAPSDVLAAHGVAADCDPHDWGRAVELVSEALCAEASLKRAA